MNSNSKRRWYQFSLRTMFVVMTLGCVGFDWWVNRSREWIRQRHEWLKQNEVQVGDVSHGTVDPPPAPGGLWLFGESGVLTIRVFKMDDEGIAKTMQLYPEAMVYQGNRRLTVTVTPSARTTSGK